MADSKHKLSPDQRAYVIKMLGAWYKPGEVVDALKDEFDVSVTIQNICQYQQSHKKDIETARTDFLKNIEAIPVANKAKRIEIRQRLVVDLIKYLWLEDVTMKRNQICHD
jgi:hypothetical protein